MAADQAESWGAEALAGREYVVLQPSSGEPVDLRMIEADASPVPALQTLGWTATEILADAWGLPASVLSSLASSGCRSDS